MLLILVAAVGIPVLAIIVFAILESVRGTTGFWERLERVGLDLCIVSIGIVGGIFMDVQLGQQLGKSGPVLAILVVLISMALGGTVMLIQNRWGSTNHRLRASAALFLGIVAIAIPSGLIIFVGSP